MADDAGTVMSVDAKGVLVKNDEGVEKLYELRVRAQQRRHVHQSASDRLEETEVVAGQGAADGLLSDEGEARARPTRRRFHAGKVSYEDAISISERMVKENVLYLDQHRRVRAARRDTSLAEEIDLTPQRRRGRLEDLDERGIIRIGAEVRRRHLVGKVTPKGETELTAEESSASDFRREVT